MNSVESVCIKSTLRTMTMDSPPLWDESISLCARGLYATLCTRLKSNVDVSIDAIAKTCKSSVYMVRKAVDELKNAGYLAIKRTRDERGKFTNRSVWVLTPYANGLQGELADMSAEQSMSRWLGVTSHGATASCERRGKGETAGQNLKSICRTWIAENSRNRRSEPKIDMPHLAPINNNSPICESPSSSYEMIQPDCSSSTSMKTDSRKINESHVDVSVCGGWGRLSKSLSERSGYIPSNCTIEQAREVYEEIRTACSEKRFVRDQFVLTLPMIDRLFDGNERWKAQVPESVRFFAGNFRGRRLPSYWISDYWADLTEHVRNSFEHVPLPSEVPTESDAAARRERVFKRIEEMRSKGAVA